MKKNALAIFLLMALCALPAANESAVTVTLEFTGVQVNGGDVYVAVYNSAESFRNDAPYRTFRLESAATVISVVTQLNEGYYRVSAFQDVNGTGILDTGLFGIPRVPVGITNWNGRGRPGNFDRLRLWIGQGTGKVTVHLSYYR